jgi:hypothetical protein
MGSESSIYIARIIEEAIDIYILALRNFFNAKIALFAWIALHSIKVSYCAIPATDMGPDRALPRLSHDDEANTRSASQLAQVPAVLQPSVLK